MSNARTLDLDAAQLVDVRDRLVDKIREGLARDEQPVRALPAHLPPPPASLEGEALVVDTGGTNMRAAVVRLAAGGVAEIVKGPVQRKLPVRDEQEAGLDAARFFEMQAALATEVGAPRGLPVGYCFSYPSEVYPDRDARLIKWTKGIDIPGVVGAKVGTALREALAAADLDPGPVRVLNDTVASLLAGSIAFDGPSGDVIGLIAGTGTNMAAYHDPSDAPKLAGHAGLTAINYESGNFAPPHLHPADDEVDANSLNPGQQRFEKAVSGFYLPFVFGALHKDREGYDPHDGTGPLVALMDDGPDGPERETARALIHRSADLVAAGLAASIVTSCPNAERVGILAEGSLFWRATGYVDRVKVTLQSLLPDGQTFDVLEPREANLVGAACAALVA